MRQTLRSFTVFKEPAPVWVLDPLDGTRNFAEGRPCFCVIVALVDQQITQAGWIFDPEKHYVFCPTGRGR